MNYLLFALSMRNVSLLMRAAAMKVTRLITPPSWPASSLVMEEGRAARKVLIQNLSVFFLFPSKEFLQISFKIQLLETSPQKQKEQS